MDAISIGGHMTGSGSISRLIVSELTRMDELIGAMLMTAHSIKCCEATGALPSCVQLVQPSLHLYVPVVMTLAVLWPLIPSY